MWSVVAAELIHLEKVMRVVTSTSFSCCCDAVCWTQSDGWPLLDDSNPGLAAVRWKQSGCGPEHTRKSREGDLEQVCLRGWQSNNNAQVLTSSGDVKNQSYTVLLAQCGFSWRVCSWLIILTDISDISVFTFTQHGKLLMWIKNSTENANKIHELIIRA